MAEPVWESRTATLASRTGNRSPTATGATFLGLVPVHSAEQPLLEPISRHQHTQFTQIYHRKLACTTTPSVARVRAEQHQRTGGRLSPLFLHRLEVSIKPMQLYITAVTALLCMAACIAGAASVPSVSSQSVELSPSVQLVGKYDWELITTEKGETWSRCLDMVW